MKKYISLLLVAAMLGLTAAVNADDHVESDDVQSTQMQTQAQDYNSSRSNKPSRAMSDDLDSDDDGLGDGTESASRDEDYNSPRSNRSIRGSGDCDDSDEGGVYCWGKNDRSEKVQQAIEARKMMIKQKREDRLSQVKQRVQSISDQKKAQFNGATKILQNKVASVDNVNWLKNTSSKIDRVMLDIQNISNEETKALVEAVLIDLQTKIDDRLQEIYESSSETTLEEILEDVMGEDVMEDEDNNYDDEDEDEDEDEEDEDEEDEDEDDEDDEEDDK